MDRMKYVMFDFVKELYPFVTQEISDAFKGPLLDRLLPGMIRKGYKVLVDDVSILRISFIKFVVLHIYNLILLPLKSLSATSIPFAFH